MMKIKFAPLQALCFAYGGFEIQILAAFEALKNNGVNVEKLNLWSKDSDFEILHCWGLSYGNFENYHWAKASNKKLVATVLLYDQETILKKGKFFISEFIGAQRVLKNMLKLADAVVVVNESQAGICNLRYKVPSGKIFIIPNIVSEKFFNADQSHSNVNDLILTTGNVCRRKNQLLLAKACAEEGVPLTIIGRVLAGEEIYGSKLKELIKQHSNITWIQGLNENSKELINHYLSCSVFALTSYVEQQPISLLEAAVLQKPLITADLPYGHQLYYKNACLIDPSSLRSMRKGIVHTLAEKDKYIPRKEPLLNCRAKEVSEAYLKVYSDL